MIHSKPAEFACRCGCGANAIDPRLASALDELRGYIGKPVIVTSGVRCAKHNKAVGGETNSYHVPDARGLCRAADITVRGLAARDIETQAYRITALRGIGRDDARRFLHVDVRDQYTRWCYRNGRIVAWFK